MTSRRGQEKREKRETLCERMAGFLKALGLDGKTEYTEKIPETLADGDFCIHKTFHHGFPSQPSCLAYDAVQKILAVATKHGTVVLLGKPGLEGSFTHPETCCVSHMEFIANKNMLITSCDNRTLYQWSIAEKKPRIKHQLQFKKECPTTMSWTYGSEWLYVGNDASNVHLVHIDNFTLSGYVIYWNAVVDGHHKMRPGDVMAVKEHPMDQGKILIAFSSSLLVLWNIRNKCCDKRYTHDPGVNHVLTSVAWLGNGKMFYSAYSDGTLGLWNPKVDNRPDKVFQIHESEPEARISKIIYKLQVQMTESDPWFICSGGYPEEPHCCPRTITVRHGKTLTLLSTNSTIIDFISLPSTPFAVDPQRPLALVILTKDELVVHDLQTENFPLFSLPHALDIHMPPVSCMEFYGNCPEELIASLHSVKSKMLHQFNSSKPWPVMGGKWGQESPYLPTDLILTGHTDGSVRLWYCSSVIFQPFFTLPTTPYFKYNYTSLPLHSNSPSPTKKTAKSPPPTYQHPISLTPQHCSSSHNHNEHKIPPPRPPPPSMAKSASTSRLHGVEDEVGEIGDVTGALRQVRSSEQFLRKVSEGSEVGGEGEGEEEEELERLKTPSPATGQLRVEGEDGTDGQQSSHTELAPSPSSSRKTAFSREKKSFFKRPSKNRFSSSDSPRLSPRHFPDNISEVSDDRSESPLQDEKEKEKEKEKKAKHKNKLQSFRKAAMKVKIGKKLISKGSSSEEKEDTDGGSLGPSEGGEEEREGEERVGGEEDVIGHEEETDGAVQTEGQSAPQRPDSLRPQSENGERGGGGGIRGKVKTKLKKGSKSFRQDKKISVLPNDRPKKSFERRTSAPGNFRVTPSQPTPTLGTPVRILGNQDPSLDPPLTPIVEISPPTVGSDSVFAAEEDLFAVQMIKCCVWGQWLCVSNSGGHVMAFSFQMDDNVTVPKTVDVNFDKDTVLKCGNTSGTTTTNPSSLGWALNERASENTPGFRLRQHVRCFLNSSSGDGTVGHGGGCCQLPLLVQTLQYSVDIGLLAVGTNKGLAVIDSETNTVLHILSSITSLLYMTNPSKFTRQVTRETTLLSMQQQSRPTIQRHSTSWTLPPSSSSTFHQLGSPIKKPASVKTPTGREGHLVGGADCSQLLLGVADEEYTVIDCESSVTALDMVQLSLDKQAPPTLTLWVGTASGHTVTYGITVKDAATGEEGEMRGSGSGQKTKKRTVQLMPTGLISEHKHPIVAMQFLNEWGDRQVVPYHLPHNSSMRVDEGRRRAQVGAGLPEASSPSGTTSSSSSSKKENYIIIVDERKIKSYLFPGMTVINRATGPMENTTLLSSQYFLCRDLPCLLTLTSSHHLLIHGLPGLRPVLSHHYTPLINQRIMSTFRVSGDGQALFMSSESEIQRLCVSRDDRLNLPDCLPCFRVAVPEPQPASKGKMDWLFGSAPAEMDRASVFGAGAGQPLMSVAKRDGVSGVGSHHPTSHSQRVVGERRGEERGREREEREEKGRGSQDGRRGREREEREEKRSQEDKERRRGSQEERERERGRASRGSIDEKKQDRRREGGGLSGQMNKNREALEQRKQALTELEEKTEQLAGDADDFATLAAKLANKNKARSR